MESKSDSNDNTKLDSQTLSVMKSPCKHKVILCYDSDAPINVIEDGDSPFEMTMYNKGYDSDNEGSEFIKKEFKTRMYKK